MGTLSGFIVGIVVGIVVTVVGLERVIGIVKEAITEAIPVLVGAI
jgi:hypothetical protein